MQIVLLLFIFFSILTSIPLIFSGIEVVRRDHERLEFMFIFIFFAVLFAMVLSGAILTGTQWHRPVELCVVDADGNRIEQTVERHNFDYSDRCVTINDGARWTQYCDYKKFIFRYLDQK